MSVPDTTEPMAAGPPLARSERRFTAAPPRLGVASVSRRGRDGVAHVARLVERAVAEMIGARPWLLDLEPRTDGVVTLGERALFTARLAAAELRGAMDGVLFTHVGLARAQRLVPAMARLPYGVFLHGVETLPDQMDGGRLALLASARLRIANSRFTARRVETQFPQIGPVVPCPLALLPEAGPPAGRLDEEMLARLSPDSVLIVGRMSATERYKGHDQLLDAWSEVLRAAPRAQLVVAGGGDDVPRLRARASAFGPSVVFCGKVTDATLAALFARARVFAMPSQGEGFGIVYLEAMRAALPCIASPGDGGADVVVDGTTGLLVDRSDPARLAAAIASLLLDRDRARALGEAGRRRYEREFTFGSFRERFVDAVRDAFARPDSTAHRRPAR